MTQKELELEYRIDDRVIDLQQQLLADKINPDAVGAIISEITAAYPVSSIQHRPVLGPEKGRV